MTANDQKIFDELKAICHRACHEREACKEGFAQMMRAETPTLLFRSWVDNWADVWRDRYPDIINRHALRFYRHFRTEANSVGLWMNECEGRGRVLVTDCDGPVDITGTARAYVVGSAEVHARDNALVYNHAASGAVVVLHDYAHGYVDAGICVCQDRSRLQMTGGTASCYGASEVYATGGTLRDHGHQLIEVSGRTAIVSRTQRKISISGEEVTLTTY